MKWTVDFKGLDRTDPSVLSAVEWSKRFLSSFDTAKLRRVTMTMQPSEANVGTVHGFCKYHKGNGKDRKRSAEFATINCHIGGRYPFATPIRLSPVYLPAFGPGSLDVDSMNDEQRRAYEGAPHSVWWAGSTAWVRRRGSTVVFNAGEALAWLFAHEAFHFLRWSRQVEGRNTEIEADAFADRMLQQYRKERTP